MFSFFYHRGGAGHIRGIQIGNYLKAKLNPSSGYENDTCIYVKVPPTESYPKHSYLDVVDAPKAVEWLRTHPNKKIGVIAISEVAKDWIYKTTGRNSILIPHHHCNYERWVRPEREVKTVGIIGCQSAFQYPVEKIRSKLKDIGLELLYDEDHWAHYNNEPNEKGKDSREKVCNFYKKIDIQIVWRPKGISEKYEKLRSPLKLENTASFGIPTVAFPEEDYVREWNGVFIPTNTIDELIYFVKRLKDEQGLYKNYQSLGLELAEKYHIESISKLYLNL